MSGYVVQLHEEATDRAQGAKKTRIFWEPVGQLATLQNCIVVSGPREKKGGVGGGHIIGTREAS